MGQYGNLKEKNGLVFYLAIAEHQPGQREIRIILYVNPKHSI